MARIEYIRHRLENWARWCAQQDGHGLGYPKQAAFARLGGKGSRAEAIIPISSVDASETHEAVNSLQFKRSDLYLVLTLIYAQNLPRHLVARRMDVTERTVGQKLEDADHAIARWLEDRQEARRRRQSLSKV